MHDLGWQPCVLRPSLKSLDRQTINLRDQAQALKLGDKRAANVVAIYSELYAVEADAKGSTHEERLALRQAHSSALWSKLAVEVTRIEHVADPKSPIAKACTYFRRQHDALAAFLEYGSLPISNAHVERLLRAVALFRKNSLFVGSIDAGKRYAVLLTLAINCTLAAVNHFDYFQSLYSAVAGRWPASRAEQLMPRAWLELQKQPQQTELQA